jgi:hypothetical protein
MVTKLNPSVITDDMMYEGGISSYDPAVIPPDVERIKADKLWGEIRREAKTNPVLQNALDRAILIYQLSKDHGTK